jgi:2'-5' RNA ligase
MNRRFLAVVPEGLQDNASLKQLLVKLKRTARERGQEVRWVAPDLWHITLVFLGTAGGDVAGALQGWQPPGLERVELRLHGVGAFPSVDEARVLWIGCQASQGFLNLQASLSERLAEAGIVAEGRREFNPHLTLGRFRNPFNAGSLVRLGGRKHIGDYRPRELILFESALQGGILKYIPVWRYGLQV